MTAADGTTHPTSLELEYLVGNAKVSSKSVFGNPQTIEISTHSLIPVKIKRLQVRIPDGAGSFTPKTIEGVDEIVRYLTLALE